MVKPLSPDEVVLAKTASMPDEVIETFNLLIATKWDGTSARITQSDAVEALCDRMKIARKDVFGRHLLDVEDIYRSKGWNVEYDRPAYNENFEASFIFKKK